MVGLKNATLSAVGHVLAAMTVVCLMAISAIFRVADWAAHFEEERK